MMKKLRHRKKFMVNPQVSSNLMPPQPQPKKKLSCWLWGCLILLFFGILSGAIFLFFIFRFFWTSEPSVPVPNELIEANTSPEFFPTPTLKEAGRENLGTNKFSVEETITLKNEGLNDASKTTLWAALVPDYEPYQRVISESITPSNYNIIEEAENKFAKFDFGKLAPAAKLEIKISYQLEVNKIKNNAGDCQGKTISGFRSPETYLESNSPKIIDLSKQITQNKYNDCEKAEAIYNYTGDNVKYEGYVPGDEGALKALETKIGDCTSFADLFLGLARAANIPSQFIEGITYIPGEENVDQLKHDWTEVYLPSTGWTPVDPTWGRFPERRQDYFSQADGDHIVLTRGRNIATLDNKHYFYYRYWWDNGDTTVGQEEDWKVVPLNK